MAFNSSRGGSTTYEDPRTGESVRVQEVTPYNGNDDSNKQLAPMRYDPRDYYQGDPSRQSHSDRNSQDYNTYASRRRVTRERYVDRDRQPASPRDRPRNRSPSSAHSSPTRDRSPRRSHSRRRTRDRKARSLSTGNVRQSARNMESRADDFFDQHFDTSFDGLVAAAAGAGIGALGARRLGRSNPYRPGQTNHSWRTLAGGIAGAAAANAGEKRFRGYLHEEEEKAEKQK